MTPLSVSQNMVLDNFFIWHSLHTTKPNNTQTTALRSQSTFADLVLEFLKRCSDYAHFSGQVETDTDLNSQTSKSQKEKSTLMANKLG